MVASTDLWSVQLRDILMLSCADNSDDVHGGVRWRLGKNDDGNVSILVCPKRSQNENRAPRYDDSEAVVLSLPQSRASSSLFEAVCPTAQEFVEQRDDGGSGCPHP